MITCADQPTEYSPMLTTLHHLTILLSQFSIDTEANFVLSFIRSLTINVNLSGYKGSPRRQERWLYVVPINYIINLSKHSIIIFSFLSILILYISTLISLAITCALASKGFYRLHGFRLDPLPTAVKDKVVAYHYSKVEGNFAQYLCCSSVLDDAPF